MKLTPISAPRQIHGEGFPEGKVSAPVGSIYTDGQATAGAVRWIKTRGTGTTGWTVEYGDTGWRGLATWDKGGSLAGELPDGITAQEGVDGGIYYRRINGTVTLRIHAARTTRSAFSIPIPPGFSPAGAPYPVVPLSLANHNTRAYSRVGAGYLYATVIGASADSPIDLPSSGSSYSSEATWGTDRAWPSTLPGIPS